MASAAATVRPRATTSRTAPGPPTGASGAARTTPRLATCCDCRRVGVTSRAFLGVAPPSHVHVWTRVTVEHQPAGGGHERGVGNGPGVGVPVRVADAHIVVPITGVDADTRCCCPVEDVGVHRP